MSVTNSDGAQRGAAPRRPVRRDHPAKPLGTFDTPTARRPVQSVGRFAHLHYDPVTGRKRTA